MTLEPPSAVPAPVLPQGDGMSPSPHTRAPRADPVEGEVHEMVALGHWEWTAASDTVACSRQARRVLDLPDTPLTSWRDLLALVPDAQRPAIAETFEHTFRDRLILLRYDYHAERQGLRREFHGRVKVGYGADGRPERLLGSIQDITDLRDYRWQLHSVSLFDPVTSLPNRALLVKRMQAVLVNAAGEGREFGVLIVGLDQFKHIHDSLGHAAGQALLQEAARRLSGWLREYDTVASLGGDEFAVLLPEVRKADDLGRIASKLLQSFVSSFTVAGTEVFITASIGAALFPADADNADELLQHADIALSHARAKGRNGIQFYARQLTAQASERLALESDLRKGIERGELRLHYQPKFELGSQRLVGAEALMRWQHPQRGLVSPLSFIPMAEETGLIVRMGTWALNEACRTVAAWNARSATPLKVAVNLSARQFGDGDLVETVTAALSATGCRPHWLEIEITESLLIDARDDIRISLETLAGMGITVALDDFGTGYSTLSYLTRLPVQTLKVDRSFVKDLPHNRNSMELARAIVSLGKGLDMVVVAEGIETQEQATFLREIGCTLAQGFLFGRPLERTAFEALLAPAPA
jgi:diguanylate cyclase (GGDEF)-like protein